MKKTNFIRRENLVFMRVFEDFSKKLKKLKNTVDTNQ